jgi:CRISPR-associated protein Cas1
LNNDRGLEIAKQVVLGKLEGQNQVLRKHGLKSLDAFRYSEGVKALGGDLKLVRARLMNIEGHFSKQYFSQIFNLFSEAIRPEGRKTFKAYDGVNNVFNLGYEMLSWKVQHALIKAKLEPYLGFLHSTAKGKPSLICDFMELYRYLVDDLAIQYCTKLNKRVHCEIRGLFNKAKRQKRISERLQNTRISKSFEPILPEQTFHLLLLELYPKCLMLR